MVHLRIVSPPEHSGAVLELFEACASVINVIRLPEAARKPDGDVILADVAREDASVLLADLRQLGLHHDRRSREHRRRLAAVVDGVDGGVEQAGVAGGAGGRA